jgi:hypothetical protein
MSIVALNLSAVKTFYSKYDPSEGDERTEFTLGAIDGFVNAAVFDKALEWKSSDAGTQTASVKMNEMDMEVVRFGLKGMRNFKDRDDNEIPFTTQNRTIMGKDYQVVSQDVLRAIPTVVIRELCAEIRTLNTLTKEEGKNS